MLSLFAWLLTFLVVPVAHQHRHQDDHVHLEDGSILARAGAHHGHGGKHVGDRELASNNAPTLDAGDAGALPASELPASAGHDGLAHFGGSGLEAPSPERTLAANISRPLSRDQREGPPRASRPFTCVSARGPPALA